MTCDIETGHDCGHLCCDEHTDPYHDHFLDPEMCPSCSSILDRHDDTEQAIDEANDRRMKVHKRGTWDDLAIVNDGRIDHEDEMVRFVAEKLHGNESMHMHQYVGSKVCPYCALRASRVLRWVEQHKMALAASS